MLNQLVQVFYRITSMARSMMNIIKESDFYDSDRDPEYTPNNVS